MDKKIEEAAEKIYNHEVGPDFSDEYELKEFIRIFKKGAKWMQSNSYTEEEVLQLLKKAIAHKDNGDIGSLTTSNGEIRQSNFNCWFDKYKKQKVWE